MSMIVKGFVGCLTTLVIAGCASTYVPDIPPAANQALGDYFQQPDNKVFVIATDPGGDYAYAYADSKASLKLAAEEATVKCDEQRKNMNIIAAPVIYAVNDKVVYEKMYLEKYGKMK